MSRRGMCISDWFSPPDFYLIYMCSLCVSYNYYYASCLEVAEAPSKWPWHGVYL